ncbi:hypothetical protein BG004_004403 [Podila humilis]|nr:hypothetical protein BG004_004403 [Podila humilis]
MDAVISEIELKLADGDLNITMDGNSRIASNNSFAKAVKERCGTMSLPSRTIRKTNTTIKKRNATTALLQMRKYILHRQPTNEDLTKVLYQHDEDPQSSMTLVNGMSSAKEYDWAPYLRLTEEVNKRSGTDREAFLKSKSYTRRREKTENLIKDLTKNKTKILVVIELVKVPEFRTSIFCCSCHFRLKAHGWSVICDECKWERDRDHNAATNMSNAVLQLLCDGQWPAPLDHGKAKLAAADPNDALNSWF